MPEGKRPTIKFSHSYEKLPTHLGSNPKVLLLAVFGPYTKEQLEAMPDLLHYDTIYYDESGSSQRYGLFEDKAYKGTYVILLFQLLIEDGRKCRNEIFTTIRTTWKYDKYKAHAFVDYYPTFLSHVGQVHDLIVEASA